MKSLSVLLFALFATCTFAQNSFFETLKSHGEGATYQRYYSVYKDDNGNQKIAGKQYQLKVEAIEHEGINAGIKITGATDNDKAGMDNFDVTLSKSRKLIGYPHVSYMVDKSTRKAYVAIDDYIFKLGNFWKDELGFNDIDAIYIKVGADSNEGGNKGGKKKKKKKFGAFMKELKDAALEKEPSECSSPACIRAQQMNLNAFVREYLEEMKKKQDAYTLSSKDKSDIAKLEKSVDGYYKKVKDKNDAFWKSEEGQAIIENRRRADSAAASDNITIRNNTGNTIFISREGSQNKGLELSPGSSGTWNCKTDAYFQVQNKVGTTYSYKATSRKAYSANGSCGGTFAIN